jgi:hypothetical protein
MAVSGMCPVSPHKAAARGDRKAARVALARACTKHMRDIATASLQQLTCVLTRPIVTPVKPAKAACTALWANTLQ